MTSRAARPPQAARLSRALPRALFHRARLLSEPVLLRALREDELVALSIHLYNTGRRMRGATIEPWEEAWWTRRLPPAPASILVAACGGGRESRWLVERGYRVHSFDPATKLVELASERLGRSAHVEVMDFARFIATAEPDAYDAVIIGWGSFSHVLSARSRTELLAACRRTCPAGPTLVSWMSRSTPASASAAQRAQSVPTRLGAAIGALRGISRDVDGDVLSRLGVAHLYGPGEVERHARDAGMKFEEEDGPYPHATLHPKPDGDAIRRQLAVEALRRNATMIARGASMAPAIPSGSRLRIVPGTPTLGDVAAATVRGELLFHRVVGADAFGNVLLKGDTCPLPDGWVAPFDVVGRVRVVDADEPADDGADDGAGHAAALTVNRSRARRAVGRFARAHAAFWGTRTH